MMTQTEALKWLAEVFECPPEEMTPDRKRADIPTWDSLGVLTLMAGLDERFGVAVTADDMQNLQQIGDVLELLRARGKLS